MKRIILNIAAIATILWGQNLQAQTLIVQGGANISHWSGEIFEGLDDPSIEEYVSRPLQAGFQVEALLDIPLNQEFSISPGLRFSQVGYIVQIDPIPNFGNGELRMNANFRFVEIPVQLRYNYEMNRDLSLYANAGGYFGAFVHGTYEQQEVIDGSTTSSSDSEFAEDFTPNFGMELGGGIDYKRFIAGISYKYGLITDEGSSAQTGVVALNIGYRLF